MGTGVAALNANSAKLLRLWFPGTANSFAMGVYTAGMSGGAALAIYVGSHLPEIHQAWWISFALIVVGLIAWFGVYRKHPNEHCSTEPVGQYMKEVLKDWHVWAISITAFLVFGMTNINGSYCVAAVTALIGDPAAAPIAGDISTINTVITCIASMAMPVLFAKMFKNMRAPFIICLAITGVTFAVTFFIPYGAWTWIAYLVILPIFMAAVMPFTKMLPTLLPSVKPEQYGVVGGIQATFQNFGMFLIASYIVSPLAIAFTGAVDGIVYYEGIYVGVGIVCAVAILSLFLFPNVRSSVAGKIADDKAAAASDSLEVIAEEDAEGILEGGHI